jgi:hypothetical protein
MQGEQKVKTSSKTSSEQETQSDVRVITSSRDLDDYDILSTMTLSVAVPHRTTESFRRLIWAAMATYGLGNSSVDHVIRRYGHLWERRSDKSFQSDPRIIALREIAAVVKEVADELDRVTPAPGVGRLCSKAALCRLEASFKAAYGLVRREYVFETDAVVRLILEQIAWAFAVHSEPDDKVFQLSPTKCIGRLKTVFPGCGVLYGLLSEWAHLDPTLAQNYVEFSNHGVDVVRRSDANAFESGANLMVLAPVYLEVAQKLFSPLTVARYDQLCESVAEMARSYASTPDS